VPARNSVASILLLLLASLPLGADEIVSENSNFSIDVSPIDGRIAMDLMGDIWTLPESGGQATLLTGGNQQASSPRWSPDGSRVLYESGTSAGSELWTTDAAGASSSQINNTDFHDQDAAWHPQGDRIVYASDRHGSGLDLWETDVATGLAWRITSQSGDESDPAWSANGRHLAWISRNEDRYALMLRRHGEADFAVLESANRISALSWRPDGSLLTFLRDNEAGKSLEMVILSEPVLVRSVAADEEFFEAPVVWRDRMHMLYTADWTIRTRGFEDRRSRPLHFRAFVASIEAPPPAPILRREITITDPPDGRLVIRGKHLFDGIWPGYRENMDVIIEAGRVVAIESRRDHDGATILDLGNITIIPGLIDAWSALDDSSASGPALLAYGVTTIVTDSNITSFDPLLWESEAIPGPRLLATAPESPTVTSSIADSATPGIDALLASRQAVTFKHIARPARRFAQTPLLASLPAPVVAGSKPNQLAPGLALHAELRALSRAGLNGELTLQAAGKNAAQMLGLENQAGTLAPGAMADLLLINGDPLSDVSDAMNIVAVVRNGRFFSLVSLLERVRSAQNVE